MAKLSLKIVTPDRIMFDGEADMVIMRTKAGDVGIMHGHQPMVTVLDYGILKIIGSEEEEKRATVFGGFAEINSEGMSVITDTAEWEDEIDVQRAKASMERAEERLKHIDADIDFMRAELSLKRAITRLNLKHEK